MKKKTDLSHLFENAAIGRLQESVNYKNLMHAVDPRDLPHRDYAPLIPFVRYVGNKNNTLKFFCPNRFNGWNTYVEFEQWDQVVNDESLTAVEAARLLLWSSNLRLHCPCPSFKFWGYQYVLTQLEAAIVPEARYPHIRNPRLKGTCCKHLRRTLKVLPFHLGNIANAIKKQRMIAPSVNEALEQSFPVSYRKGEMCDVYSNPSRKEYIAAKSSNDDVRAFLNAGQLLVWNTFGALHQTVRETLNLGPDAIPLMIYGNPLNRHGAEIVITDNTKYTPWHHNGDVVDIVLENPQLQRLFGNNINISFYDEDIVGDWRYLDQEEKLSG